MSDIHYWGYRINNDKAAFFEKELKKNQLRQGWGYNENQNLRNSENVLDDGARRNLPIYDKVKKGDYLIIPHLPTWDTVTIAQATEDFKDGYRYEIDAELNDFGHIFPAKFVKEFNRHNINVGANIKSSFKCISRFWNMDYCENDIQKLINCTGDLLEGNDINDGWLYTVDQSFNEDEFAKKIYNGLVEKYNAAEWEFVLREGFKMMLPDNVIVETTANKEEKKHGSDLFIKIPGIFETTYVIAIQVKDYCNEVSGKVIDQINKVDTYFEKNSGVQLIDKYVIITRADRSDNDDLVKKANDNGIKLIFKNELIKLLSQMAKAYIGNRSRYCES